MIEQQNSNTSKTENSIKNQESGRATLILVLGILSIILLGPIVGIPAWIMGRHDLQKIRDGIIDVKNKKNTKIGMILGIIGTVFTTTIICISLIVGISIYKSNLRVSTRYEVLESLNNLAEVAKNYYWRPKLMGGGGHTYQGFRLDTYDPDHHNKGFQFTGAYAANSTGFFQISNHIPSICDYDLTSGGPSSTTDSLVLVGWGNVVGDDGIHKVQVYVIVANQEVKHVILN